MINLLWAVVATTIILLTVYLITKRNPFQKADFYYVLGMAAIVAGFYLVIR